MPDPNDQQAHDYAEGQRGPRPEGPPPADGPAKRWPTPLRLALQVGFVFATIGLFMGGAILMQGPSREAARRVDSQNCLKVIGLGVQNYHDAHDELPKNTYTGDGKPLLSWRVYLLPYI